MNHSPEYVARLEAALRRIEKWFGEFPETGRFWDDDQSQPMRYMACFGSNGERDYMRDIARVALLSASHIERRSPLVAEKPVDKKQN